MRVFFFFSFLFLFVPLNNFFMDVMNFFAFWWITVYDRFIAWVMIWDGGLEEMNAY